MYLFDFSLITFRLRIFEAKMKDRNNDMRMNCTICSCKEYVAAESVKCAFCGHFPILHQIISAEDSSNSTSTATANNIQSDFALPSEPLHIPKEKFGSFDSSSCSVNVSEPASESPKENDLEERDEENDDIGDEEVDNVVSETARINTKHKQKITVKDGLPYLLKRQSDGFVVVCQVCNVTVSPGEHHRGTTLIIDHTKTPRHRLNLTLVSDLYSVDEKVQKLMNMYPNTFMTSKQGKKVLKCTVCDQEFKIEAKLLLSNILHLDGKKHATNSKKRPSSSSSITSFFQKKRTTYEPIEL